MALQAVPGRAGIFRQASSVHKDLPETAPFGQNSDHIGRLHDSVERVIGAARSEDLTRPLVLTFSSEAGPFG